MDSFFRFFPLEFWKAVSLLGDWRFVVPAVLLVGVILLWRGFRREGILFGTVLLLSECVTYLTKVLVHSPRPLNGLVVSDDPYSFPSGHSAIAFAFYGMVAALLYAHWARAKGVTARVVARVLIFLAFFVIVGFVGASRLALGVHFPVDVLGGYALGALFLLAFVLIRRRGALGSRASKS